MAMSREDHDVTQMQPSRGSEAQVRRIVGDLAARADVVGLTIAEFIPRQVIHLQQLLTGFPLLHPAADPS